MRSSNGFGGGATGAGPRVEICPAAGAESGTVVPAEQEVRRRRKRQLFPNHHREIDGAGPGRQRVEVRVVRRLGIGRKHRRADVGVNLVQDLGEAAAALTAHHGVDGSTPEVLAFAGGLELTVYQDVSDQIEAESLKGGVVGLEFACCLNGTALQVPNVHSQHSRLR